MWTWRARLALVLLVTATCAAPRLTRAASFLVDDTGEASDADTGDGLCATAVGACTLRAAIEQANALGGAAHTITLPPGPTW